jgi:hypothetical protein
VPGRAVTLVRSLRSLTHRPCFRRLPGRRPGQIRPARRPGPRSLPRGRRRRGRPAPNPTSAPPVAPANAHTPHVVASIFRIPPVGAGPAVDGPLPQHR